MLVNTIWRFIQFLRQKPNKTTHPTDELLKNIFSQINGILTQRKSKEYLIAEHERQLRIFSNKECHTITTSNLGHVRNFHDVKLRPKNRISISNLQLDKVHTGRFLLCQVISKCIKLNALTTLVEDPEGEVERICLYNWIHSSAIPAKGRLSTEQTSKFLPIGTKLAIKNPYYKIGLDLKTMIRFDNPSECTDLSESKEHNKTCKQTADDYRRRGNDYFESNNFKEAVDEYSNGIRLEPHNVTLIANRAEAYLRLNQFGNSLSDVENVLKRDPAHIKAGIRKCKALCGLKRYQGAIITIQDLHKRLPGNITLIKQLKHAKIDGNWICEHGPRLDHADYLNDDIEIRPVRGKGKGWFAKRDIPERTLLMVSKAFGIVYNNEASSILSIDFLNRTMSGPAQSELVNHIAHKLMAEPYLCRELYQLYGGPIEKLYEDSLLTVDIMKINRIISYNAFDPMDKWKFLKNIQDKDTLRNGTGAGLWILPSYFNHSCIDINVDRLCLGDLMFLRAWRPILKDEELNISYCCPKNSYEIRSKRLKNYDIDCQCRLCIKLDFVGSISLKLLKSLSFLEQSHCLMALNLILLSSKNLPNFVTRSNGNIYQSLSDMQEIYYLFKASGLPYPVNAPTFQISILHLKLCQLKEAEKWFDVAFKEITEPLKGKYKNNKVK
ncbi:2525_t:CDS:2 [Funneliformis mosseae]|uniref:2525_t:CDS:1 n=1 Tax=Funneliformis mosseae TaxID=27381 RepID=A0A9N9GYE8_FUNMO|nr:2525_t:CDS:2 [Funneliformis mosseae]